MESAHTRRIDLLEHPHSSLDPSIWVAIITSVTGGIGWIARWWWTRRTKYRIKKWTAGYEDIHATYRALSQLVSETSAIRANILTYENGGGIPKPGSPVFMSIVYEVFVGTEVARKDQWQRQEVTDPDYFRFLGALLQTKRQTLITKEMPRSTLRVKYEAFKVARSEIHLLYQNSKTTYTLAVHFATDAPLSPNDSVHLDMAVSDIRNLFMKRS